LLTTPLRLAGLLDLTTWNTAERKLKPNFQVAGRLSKPLGGLAPPKSMPVEDLPLGDYRGRYRRLLLVSG